jgi:hypothetical protein
MVQLSDTLIVVLDQEAGRRGISRSAPIRDLLEASLRDEREAEIDRKIVEGYTRIPPGTPDEWGELAQQSDAGVRDLFARLDADERDAGSEAW